MALFLKKRWVLLLILLVFTICKIPHLQYAFYWDECWPYAVAVKDMYHHGASLLPSSMNIELSRGHPLLFHALAALWMDVFGDSHVAMHAFPLFVALVVLAAVYEAGLALFNVRVAALAAVLLAIQIMFFVQASFVLPEVMVALFAFLGLYFYTRDKYIPAILSITALFYTKESGAVMGLILGLYAFIGLFNGKVPLATRINRLLMVAVPCVLIGIFFVLQYSTRGWFLFPYHKELIVLQWDKFWFNLRINCLAGMFLYDLRYYYFILLGVLAIAASVKNRKLYYLVFVPPVVILYYAVDFVRSERAMPAVPFFIVLTTSVALMIFGLARLRLFNNKQLKFLILSIIFIYLYLCFASINFFTPRYLVMSLVPMMFFTAVILNTIVEQTYRPLYFAVLLSVLAIGGYSAAKDDHHGDCNLGAFDGLNVQQHVVDYMEGHGYYEKAIGCSYLNNTHLTDTATGFLRSGKKFKNVKWDINKKTEFAIFDNIESDYRYADIKQDSTFHVIDRYEKGKVWAEIWGRK